MLNMGMLSDEENGTMTPLSRIMANYKQMLENNWTPEGPPAPVNSDDLVWVNAPEIDTRVNTSPEESFSEACRSNYDASKDGAYQKIRAGLFDNGRGPIL